MNKLFLHRYWYVLLLLLLVSCKEDEAEDKQRKEIESYITGTLKKTIDERDGVYYVPIDSAYIDSAERVLRQVERGDMVLITYAASTLKGGGYATNDDSIAIKNGLELFLYMASVFKGDFFVTNNDSVAIKNGLVPLDMGGIKVGAGQVLTGLDRGLERMVLGDQSLLIFPYTLGYGKEYVGLVPGQSALMFQVIVTQITKK